MKMCSISYLYAQKYVIKTLDIFSSTAKRKTISQPTLLEKRDIQLFKTPWGR
jgi:hypothetical protein